MKAFSTQPRGSIPAVGGRKLARKELCLSRRHAATRAQAAESSIELPGLLEVDGKNIIVYSSMGLLVRSSQGSSCKWQRPGIYITCRTSSMFLDGISRQVGHLICSFVELSDILSVPLSQHGFEASTKTAYGEKIGHQQRVPQHALGTRCTSTMTHHSLYINQSLTVWAHAGDFPARHTFSGYANWLVPGYVMVGQYPFVHGSTCKAHGDGEARLQQILQACSLAMFGIQHSSWSCEPASGIPCALEYPA